MERRSLRRSSTYSSLPPELANLFPPKFSFRDSWLKQDDKYGGTNEERDQNNQLESFNSQIPKGQVMEKAKYFDTRPLSFTEKSAVESKSPPSEQFCDIAVKYRYRKPQWKTPSGSRSTNGTVAKNLLKWETIIKTLSQNEREIKLGRRKDKDVLRRRTVAVPPMLVDSLGEYHGNKIQRRSSPVPAAEADSNHRIPDQVDSSSYLDASEVGCRSCSCDSPHCRTPEPGIAPANFVARSAIPCHRYVNLSTPRSFISMGIPTHDDGVPRVVGAYVKSFKDIPEELFDRLPESSVDPSPEDNKADRTSSNGPSTEWGIMQEGRRELLAQREMLSLHDNESDVSEKGSCGASPFVSTEGKDVRSSHRTFRDDQPDSREGTSPQGDQTPPPPLPPRIRKPFPYHKTSEELSQLERDLQAAGVFFRKPPSFVPPAPPPLPEDAQRRRQQQHDQETQVALETLDASLEALSETSSESSPTHSEDQSPDEGSPDIREFPSFVITPYRRNASSKVEMICASFESTDKKCALDPKEKMEKLLNGRTLIHASGANVDKVLPNKAANMESFNLIEEMYVSTKKRPLPKSTVEMTAFYPGINFTSDPCRNGTALAPDSDSGHESGATSPCGTLTGEDPSSPPPSPSNQKNSDNKQSSENHNSQSNCAQDVPIIDAKSSSKMDNANDRVDSSRVDKSVPPDNNDSQCGQNSPSVAGVVPSHENAAGTVCYDANPSNHFVVVAIDFGTTYSGYAFSFTRDPESIHMMKKWDGGDPGIQNQKTPTIVLLTPDEEFHSLGFTARDFFHDLDPKEAARWLYFDKFKMELHSNQTLTRSTLLEASNGKTVAALTIFSHALRYFRDHAIKELCDHTGVQIEEEDVRWVITVPAIWSHAAKQFMRAAAYQATMGSPQYPDQLLIALEPEAAAIYCRRLRRNQLLPERSPEMRERRTSCLEQQGTTALLPNSTLRSRHLSLPPECPPTPDLDREEQNLSLPFSNSPKVSESLHQGTIYMVVDCGGGTVDITVHQMTDRRSGHLKELHKASGGPYGSTGVDNEFKKLLNVIFGTEFMTAFRKQKPAAYVDLMVAFESRKRNASPFKSTPLNIALPFAFIDLYRKFKGKEIESAIKKHSNLGVMWSSQGMLRIEQETMTKLFLPTLEKITEAINSALSSPEVVSLQYMFLVGGFSESEVLQKHIRDEFDTKFNVIIPQGMGLAILRGAVQFGLDPSVVTVRRSRLTYGVGILNRFQEGVHLPEKKVLVAGDAWCADVLDKYVTVDQSVAVGDVIMRSYTPATKNQKAVVLHLYATSKEGAKYVTDEGVRRVGTLHLELEDQLKPKPSEEETLQEEQKRTEIVRREITTRLRFGGTEIKASAVDQSTGQNVKCSIDFLSL